MQYVNLPCANGVVTVAGTVGVAPVPVLKLVGVVAVVGEDSIKNMKYSAYKKMTMVLRSYMWKPVCILLVNIYKRPDV